MSIPKRHLGPDGHRLICKLGHRVEGENRVVSAAGRVGCRICRTAAAAKARAAFVEQTSARSSPSRAGSRRPLQIGMTPVQLSEAMVAYARALEDERPRRRRAS